MGKQSDLLVDAGRRGDVHLERLLKCPASHHSVAVGLELVVGKRSKLNWGQAFLLCLLGRPVCLHRGEDEC